MFGFRKDEVVRSGVRTPSTHVPPRQHTFWVQGFKPKLYIVLTLSSKSFQICE